MNFPVSSTTARLAVAAVFCVSLALPAQAYENDVHYGLTYWLALKAGFAENEAEALATGNARMNSGGPQAIDANLDYACAAPDVDAARRVQQAHYPSSEAVPSAPAKSVVLAGSLAARQEIERVLKQAKGHEGQMLSLFGRALHTWQDSWAHAGTRQVPDLGRYLRCDPDLFLGSAAIKRSANPHMVDLTASNPTAVIAMAKATFEVLASYPVIKEKARTTAAWSDLVGPLGKFARARTKLDKQAWFAAEGMKNTSFLENVSLLDGPDFKPTAFTGSLLPTLNANVSNQYEAPEGQRRFFDALFATWIAAGSSDESLLPFLSANAIAVRALPILKLLKVRDHGLTASLLHKTGPLTRRELKLVDTWARDTALLVRPSEVANAFLPVVAKGDRASPLLPYLLRSLPVRSSSAERVIAITRLKHLPHDTQGWIAEKTNASWKLLEVIIVADQ